MLHITRRIGETIIINNDIEITILDITGKKVKLGCKFPKNNTVFRKELHEKISHENLAAGINGSRDEEAILSDLNYLLYKSIKK